MLGFVGYFFDFMANSQRVESNSMHVIERNKVRRIDYLKVRSMVQIS